MNGVMMDGCGFGSQERQEPLGPHRPISHIPTIHPMTACLAFLELFFHPANGQGAILVQRTGIKATSLPNLFNSGALVAEGLGQEGTSRLKNTSAYYTTLPTNTYIRTIRFYLSVNCHLHTFYSKQRFPAFKLRCTALPSRSGITLPTSKVTRVNWKFTSGKSSTYVPYHPSQTSLLGTLPCTRTVVIAPCLDIFI